MTILITGGTGFIGASLAGELIRMKKDVVLFDSLLNVGRIEKIRGAVKLVRGNLAVPSNVLDVVKEARPEVIFHLGAILSAEAERHPMNSYAVNFEGTLNLLEASRIFAVRQVIYPSSIASYGPGLPQPVLDEMPQRPTTVYGISKVFGELWGEWYSSRFGLDFKALRLPSVVGAGRGGGGASAFSTMIIENAARGVPYEIDVDEGARIPILYVRDAVRALLTLMEARGLPRRIYNIAGISPSAGELVSEVKRHIPDASLVFRPKRETMSIINSWPQRLDDSPAQKDWGWRSKYLLPDMVKDFIMTIRNL